MSNLSGAQTSRSAGPPAPPAAPGSPVRRVGLFGAGTIGGGWAATYLARGYEVLVFDPAASAEQRTRSYLDRVWGSVRRATPGTAASVPHADLRFVSADEAVHAVALVHENGPEDVAAKQAIFAVIEQSAPSDLVICSSSGGLMPSELQARMTHAHRLVVAHPLSPVYALPLVEVLGGRQTSEATIEFALAHLARLDKKPIRLRREVPGYLTNRLTFALLREAVHCLAEGVADAQSIEDAVVFGVTPRYAVGGPLTSLALAGGQAGMKGAMDSFAPAIETWWSDLGSPHLTDEVKAILIEAADTVVGGRTMAEVVAERDKATVDVVALLHSTGTGSDTGAIDGNQAEPAERE